jgi:hypothetical protein
MIKLSSLISETISEKILAKDQNQYKEIENKALKEFKDLISVVKQYPQYNRNDFRVKYGIGLGKYISCNVFMEITKSTSDGYFNKDKMAIVIKVPTQGFTDEQMIEEFLISFKHEFDHFLQYGLSSHKKPYGFEKKNIRNKDLGAQQYGLINVKDPNNYHSKSIEFKPWLNTHVTFLKKYVNDSNPGDLNNTIFKFYIDRNDFIKRIKQGLDDEAENILETYEDLFEEIEKSDKYSHNLDYMKKHDLPRWKQMVKEMYKELFK